MLKLVNCDCKNNCTKSNNAQISSLFCFVRRGFPSWSCNSSPLWKFDCSSRRMPAMWASQAARTRERFFWRRYGQPVMRQSYGQLMKPSAFFARRKWKLLFRQFGHLNCSTMDSSDSPQREQKRLQIGQKVHPVPSRGGGFRLLNGTPSYALSKLLTWVPAKK